MKKFDVKMLNNCCSGLFLNDLRRVVLLAVVFSLAGSATAGCSSTGEGFKAGLIAPATHAPQDSESWDGAGVPNIRQHAEVF
jgi:hypothetical protein